MDFNQFKKELRTSVDTLLSNISIFEVDVVKEDIWNLYLNSFDEAERQGYNCNSCRSFIKNYGGLVMLCGDFTLHSIWKMQCSEPGFQKVVDALNAYVISRPIKEVFLTPTKKLGTDFNFSGTGVKWQHLYAQPMITVKREKYIPTLLNESRTAHHSLSRAFKEIKPIAVFTVLELIAENALYRGNEHHGLLKSFNEAQTKYLYISEPFRDNFVWSLCTNRTAFTSIRGSVIGTLLVDLSEEGANEERCIKSYESKVAPANYQRPKALVTSSQVDKFKADLRELGFEDSIYRAFADPRDLMVNNLLYIRDQKSIKDIFDEIKVETKVLLPSSIKPAREIKLDEFVNLVSSAKDLSIFMENAHETNLFSLIGPSYKESPSMFKWDNPFSWSYNNGMADAIKMRVKAAGGSTDGQVRVSLAWETSSDLDLHIYENINHHIYFAEKTSTLTGGTLDVDQNASSIVPYPVENIIYPHGVKLPDGNYKIKVHNFNDRAITNAFTVEVEINGQIFTYEHTNRIRGEQYVNVGELIVKSGVITYNGRASSRPQSKQVWGLPTNTFHKVLAVFPSPNYWDGNAVGNKHIFFQLEGAENPTKPMGFFNEQIKSELTQHHKHMFEAVASKLEVEKKGREVSGLGFSTTSSTSFFCKIDNKQIIKVTI